MRLFWGVDSVTPANAEIRTPQRYVNAGEPPRQKLFEYVTRRVRQPDFWGRYLNEYRSGVTADEVSEIHRMSHGNCRVLPVYNGPHRTSIELNGPNAHRAGVNAAREALRLAGELDMPHGVRIYADLERWLVGAEWFRGWFETMYASPFPAVGGVYGNVQVQWRLEGWRAGFDAALGAFADSTFDQLLGDLAGRGRSKSTTAFIWSNRPYLTQPGAEPPQNMLVQTTFRPERGPLNFVSDTVVWQYGPNVPLRFSAPLVDLNLSTDAGYAEMWARGMG